ncbi:FMN-dependent NADH-azoreductase [Streptomyces sp. NBC_00568]|uniref:FMN-dependent NADH-azoreductase n=1 Tax=Streptomyces sp. NBC_00568 TaxID=2975779 RepID=UPI002250AE8C|nr:NAD(P)H-dependent oxidoreductase [Streptomyces sp. NBC_00568]MCX4993583.1 NAD(P)H-dependent oxidoreductase [Streptomyces sp. NBC_00568]
MSTLLHIDSSPRRSSVSRQISGAFAEAWRTANPNGIYVHRDLAAAPVPHIDQAQIEIMHRLEREGIRDLAVVRDAAVTADEKESWAVAWPLIEELLAADTVVLGVPMYNFSVPSTFKAWFDRILIAPLIADPVIGAGPLSGKKVVVASARGGAYGPGTPRHGSDFQEPYLRAALAMIGLADDLTFLHAEMTKSAHVPRLAGFQDLAASSFQAAVDGARSHAAA